MNTARSVAYGWGTLMAAGGIAYYLAKRDITSTNEARRELATKLESEQRHLREMEEQYLKSIAAGTANSTPALQPKSTPSPTSSSQSSPSPVLEKVKASDQSKSAPKALPPTCDRPFDPSDGAPHPGQEVEQDPIATRHPPTTVAEQEEEKSKYEPTEPFRSIKGDRLTGFWKRS